MAVAEAFQSLTRHRRRTLVTAALVGYPVAVAVLLTLKRTTLPPAAVLAGFAAALMVGVLGPLTALYGYGRCRADGGRRAGLDERDRALVGQAYVASHRVLTWVLLAATLGVVGYLSNGNVLTLDAVNATPAVLWIVVYLPALPTLMLAWIEPDPVADD